MHLAWDEAHQRPVALKLILEFTDREEKRFRRESGIASGLRHPHILPVLAYGTLVGEMFRVLYLVTPYVEGQTLDLAPRALAEKLGIVADIADALDYAHGQNVVHRDVKPTNILVDSAGRGTITDFGIAKSIQERGEGVTVTGSIVGTPHYMSPEQARGETRIGPATDIFSLGATLYHIATGHLPFESEASAMQIIRRMATESPARPSSLNPELDPALEKVILTAMHPDPNQRFETAAAMGAAIREVLIGGPARPRKGTRRSIKPVPSARERGEADVPLEAAEQLLGLYELTDRALDEEDLRRIEAGVDESLRIHPAHARAWVVRGRLAMLRRDWDGAIRAFDEAAHLAPDSSLALGWRGRATVRKYQALRGIPPVFFFEGVVTVEPWERESDEERELRAAFTADLRSVERMHGRAADPRPGFLAGVLDLYEGRYGDAIARLSEALAVSPLDGDAWLSLGIARMMNEDFPGALEAFTRGNSIRKVPLCLRLEAVMWASAANAKRVLGETALPEVEASISRAAEAVRLAPDDLRIRRTYVVQLCDRVEEKKRLGLANAADYEEALRAARELVSLDAENVYPREVLSGFLILCAQRPNLSKEERRRYLEEAIGLSRGSLALNPTWAESLGDLATALLDRAKLDGDDAAEARCREALELIERALQLSPRQGEFYMARALACHRLGRGKEAAESLERALALKPQLETARREVVAEIRGD